MSNLSRRVIATQHSNGFTLLDTKTGRYWQLNETAAVVYEALAAGGTIADGSIALAERFDVPLASAERDARELHDALVSEGLLAK